MPDGGSTILAFDLTGEKFYEVPTPPRDESELFHSLRNIGGRLCFISDTHTRCILGNDGIWSAGIIGTGVYSCVSP